MATKIRLQRHGRKRRAIYHIVAADSRAKRDGKFIEKLGIYNPNSNPASIDLDFDRALYWVQVGAEMTDTARSILSYEGILMKNHLDGGVKKGAFSQEEAEKRFEAWKSDKSGKIDSKVKGLADAAEKAKKDAFAAETKIKEDRAAEIAARNAEALAAAEPEVEVAEAAAEEAPVVEEVAEEAPVVEAAAEEAPAEEAAEEAEEKAAE